MKMGRVMMSYFVRLSTNAATVSAKVGPLLKDAQAWAIELSKGSRTALALSKAILDKSFELGNEEVSALGREAQAICYTTTEHHVSVAAFLGRKAR